MRVFSFLKIVALLFVALFSINFIWNTFAAEECITSDCINSPNFKVNVSTFTPGWDSLGWGTWVGTVNNVLSNIIDKLIIAFWALSLLVMTIGAGYMIVYHGQDEFLSRWKAIFIAGITSLAIALSAGLIVKFIAYLLYA